LNENEGVDGIILGIPLPEHLKPQTFEFINHVKLEKDVDGMSDKNIRGLYQCKPHFIPCTPLATMRILQEARINLNMKNCVILNRGSRSVGLPLYALMEQQGATV